MASDTCSIIVKHTRGSVDETEAERLSTNLPQRPPQSEQTGKCIRSEWPQRAHAPASLGSFILSFGFCMGSFVDVGGQTIGSGESASLAGAVVH
jgi:hypothetical protein